LQLLSISEGCLLFLQPNDMPGSGNTEQTVQGNIF